MSQRRLLLTDYIFLLAGNIPLDGAAVVQPLAVG
jgi:hypothetical protein